MEKCCSLLICTLGTTEVESWGISTPGCGPEYHQHPVLLVLSNVLYNRPAFKSHLRSKDNYLAELNYQTFDPAQHDNMLRIPCINIILKQPCLASPGWMELRKSDTESVLWIWDTVLICRVIRTLGKFLLFVHLLAAGIFGNINTMILPPFPHSLTRWHIHLHTKRMDTATGIIPAEYVYISMDMYYRSCCKVSKIRQSFWLKSQTVGWKRQNTHFHPHMCGY